MRITTVTPIVVSTPPPHRGGRNWVFAKLTADDGTDGIGFTGIRQAETHYGSVTLALELPPAAVVHRRQGLAVQCKLEPVGRPDLDVVRSSSRPPNGVFRNHESDRAVEVDRPRQVADDQV